MKLLLFALLLGTVSCVIPQEVASPGQIAYAISQNYDQTGPGEKPQTQQQTLANLQQTRPQVFSQPQQQQQQQSQPQQQPQPQQQYQQQQYQQYLQVPPPQYQPQFAQIQQQLQFANPQQELAKFASQAQQTVAYQPQLSQAAAQQYNGGLFARYQASHALQPQATSATYNGLLAHPSISAAAPQQYVTYTQPQVRYTQQPLYAAQQTQQQQVKTVVPQYQYDVNALSSNDLGNSHKQAGEQAIFGSNYYARTNLGGSGAGAGGFTPIKVQPQQQQYQDYVVPVAKATYNSPVVVRALYPTATKAALAAPIKFSGPGVHYGFSQ